jgi:hypothetical protein
MLGGSKSGKDLLEEIRNDPEFSKIQPVDTEKMFLKSRISNLELQQEALLMCLKARNFITEKLYLLAIDCIREDVEYLATTKSKPADNFLEESMRRFVKEASVIYPASMFEGQD